MPLLSRIVCSSLKSSEASLRILRRFVASKRFSSSIFTRCGQSNVSRYRLTEPTLPGDPEGLNCFKRFGSSKRYYSSSTRSTSSNKPSLPLPEQAVASVSWRSFLIPGSVLAGIGGLVLFIHYNDEKRAVPKESKENTKVLPVFVTIDPQRDTPSQLRAYIREFDSRIVGLTGPVAAIRQMAQEYRVYFKKVDEEGDDYLVESSHNMYLINPNMEVTRSFGVEYSAEELAEAITKEMRKTKTTISSS
ncbi:UNVERIFIED_CONTAM: protein SCO12, mitochondrial [Sesamum calycinum]|uniref:Protein SCO12, mitochondrial n=1 Tax=Sesamum calycinum TaxID=2727403 RepID=A0AAW2MR94_9LAMI